METIAKKILAITGAGLGLAITLMPLTSYAESEPFYPETKVEVPVLDENGNPVTGGPDDEHQYPYNTVYYPNERTTDSACHDSASDKETCAKSSGGMDISVNVDSVIAIDAAAMNTAADNNIIHITANMATTGTFATRIRSAMPYTISLSAERPYLTNIDNDEFIIQPSSTITPGKSAWGIKKLGADGVAEDNYTALGYNPVVFYTGEPTDLEAGGASDAKGFVWKNFPVGVSSSSKLPQGTYATEVNVLATVKDTLD